LRRELTASTAVIYIGAQVIGAIVGVLATPFHGGHSASAGGLCQASI
jgi:glycerol uptake facilitator-like aquaporin